MKYSGNKTLVNVSRKQCFLKVAFYVTIDLHVISYSTYDTRYVLKKKNKADKVLNTERLG